MKKKPIYQMYMCMPIFFYITFNILYKSNKKYSIGLIIGSEYFHRIFKNQL